MTPLSSMLEASNAGHMNPEPITTRWMRGITWRMTREVILMAFFFGWIFNFFFLDARYHVAYDARSHFRHWTQPDVRCNQTPKPCLT